MQLLMRAPQSVEPGGQQRAPGIETPGFLIDPRGIPILNAPRFTGARVVDFVVPIGTGSPGGDAQDTSGDLKGSGEATGGAVRQNDIVDHAFGGNRIRHRLMCGQNTRIPG